MAVSSITHNGIGLCAVVCRLVGGRIAQNPCYKLAAVNYRKTQIEAQNKKNLKKEGGNK